MLPASLALQQFALVHSRTVRAEYDASKTQADAERAAVVWKNWLQNLFAGAPGRVVQPAHSSSRAMRYVGGLEVMTNRALSGGSLLLHLPPPGFRLVEYPSQCVRERRVFRAHFPLQDLALVFDRDAPDLETSALRVGVRPAPGKPNLAVGVEGAEAGPRRGRAAGAASSGGGWGWWGWRDGWGAGPRGGARRPTTRLGLPHGGGDGLRQRGCLGSDPVVGHAEAVLKVDVPRAGAVEKGRSGGRIAGHADGATGGERVEPGPKVVVEGGEGVGFHADSVRELSG